MRTVIVADDLTGAADSVVAFAGAAVALDPENAWPDACVVAADTDSRYAPPEVARARVRAAVRRAERAGARVVKKIDSTLRGHVAAEVAAAAEALGARLVVVAPAFPATGRTTLGGVVHVDGRPLPERRHGGDVAALLGEAGMRVRTMGLAQLREPGLDARFAQTGGVIVCDGETDADLDAVAAAVPEGALLVGSGGVTAALAGRARAPRAVRAKSGPSLVVVGSYSDLARSQRLALIEAGWTPVTLRPDGPGPDEAGKAVRDALTRGDVVLSVDPDAPVDRSRAFATARALAQAAAAAAPDAAVLAATGGETARAVLAALGASELRPVGEPEPGVVASRVPGTDALFVTKAGAFGDRETLARVLRAVSDQEE
ncbi:four-carbon acid sugar kinase family protein [Actinomadura violacea]|uniref:4-hydroxythreonine-4-phosphate dehydrogenase n=1 Tax=Actinomadura violacea TaxID=2819934 RepID=A0ABS3S5Q4_9ACTN|nr:four-carbon acid sugar kinase family protein [Actinomadura violacea]MBO2464338.1 hypothetical protein [Actinomadura violacea]